MYEYEIRNGIRQKDLLTLKEMDSDLRSYIKTEMKGRPIEIQKAPARLRARKSKKAGLFRWHKNNVLSAPNNCSEPRSN